ncbi:uncharacterized protein LOC110236852 [Exaiptasia diaphana]|uniref:ShKT domain-containing protein n=1 Tax=Exaiptasia diaphana TaxID=2652724 RepID=A0A913X2W4_EXADI|nr:uncharacterized protein LOC110236852 [Exaiptasia diaphana]KXJ15813.1 hypothetical protein AC249_AIPGENE11982 [Exaiptasia diaphana]
MGIYGVLFLSLCLVLGASGVQPRRKPRERLSRTEKIAMIKKSPSYIADLKRLRPGQKMPSFCAYSEYGCCKDQNTFAEGKFGMSCEVKLCIDKTVAYCYFKRMRKHLYCGESMPDSKRCPYSCGHCSYPAPPIKRCLERNPAFGCCWDGLMPLGKHGRGCRPCMNIHEHTCALFKNVAGGCESGSWGIRTYMIKYCPLSCGFCEEANFSQLRQSRRRHQKQQIVKPRRG